MKKIVLLCVLLIVPAGSAFAQYTGESTYGSAPAHKADIVFLGGYAFTMSSDVTVAGLGTGEIDLEDAAFYGVALDFNVVRQTDKQGQIRLLWRREDSDLVFRPFIPGDPSPSVDLSVEYWQIGGVGGVRRGKTMPFTSVTLGATRFAADGNDDWKFSMIFGLGVKVYTSDKIGIMIQGNWPITFTDAWGGATVGTGGAGVAIGGTGISQLDIGGGLLFQF